MVAIVVAKVHTSKGVFAGIGDASPTRVAWPVLPHLVCVAEIRAKARAQRDAVNVGVVALEELGGEGKVSTVPSHVTSVQKPMHSQPDPPRSKP